MRCSLLLGLFLFGLSACEATTTQPLRGELRLGFDELAAGKLPAGWVADATRRVGPLATWEVADSAGAPSAPHALSLSYPNHKQYDSFNLCWTPAVQFADGTLEVSVCARSGKEDQGGGILWRAQGPDDYYIVRLNPLESNLRLYVVQRGNREMLASAEAKAELGRWYRLAVTHQGQRIECRVDGQLLLTVDDATLPQAGGVGVWTKADAATDFDDFVVLGR
jgi:hypothetical protein